MTEVTAPSATDGGRRPAGQRERSVVREAMTRFLLLGSLALGLVALLTVLMASTVARAIATSEAEVRTLSFAKVIAAPGLDASTREDVGNGPLVEALQNRLADDSITHAAVYDTDGRVIWSADPAAVGTTEELSAEVQELLDSGGTVSDFAQETHAGGTADAVVLEVYAAAVAADGEPFVMEWYWPTAHLESSEAQLMRLLLPLTLGSLLLVALLFLPLTLSTARRVERDRARLTRHALNASRIERRRLSEDLHDGVVQDLSGIGYIVPVVANDLPENSQGHALLDQVRESMQRNIAALRAMIAEIRPMDVTGEGLVEALYGLAARMTERGVETAVSLNGDLQGLSPTAQALVYRVAREGARNVVRHSQAEHARIEVSRRNGLVRVAVCDDGVGLTADRSARHGERAEDHHFGLELLREAVSDLGGELLLSPGADGGAELVVTFHHARVAAV